MRHRILVTCAALLWSLAAQRSALAVPAQQPLFLVTGVSPMVMFAMSVDHQLFQKAFADYSDLNGDGVLDITYTDGFDYYGYFDSDRCYSYDTGSDLFEPEGVATGPNGHHCAGASGDWSGNFLNWATMTRVDVLRKALFGGKRALDTTSGTILERALLPYDVHAFAKVFTPAAGDSTANYTPYNESSISLCNVTPRPASGSPDETEDMDTSVNHPKVLVARGSWPSWSAGEIYQCVYSQAQHPSNPSGTFPSNANNLVGPGTGQGLSVRVDVCVAGKLEANCKVYDVNSAAKPTGLLQEYGEDGRLRFGLATGSYQKRDKGGVLRKAMGLLAGNSNAADDEIDLVDGTFNSGVNGIIATLNKVRLNTYDYSEREYDDCNTFGISISTYLNSSDSDRRCSNWGNPVSELYLEAIRYLIGEGSPTSTFDVSADSLGLPSATWDDPMGTNEWCAPMNLVVLSSGDNSFDADHLGSVPSVLGNVASATNAIGTAEGFSGDVFIGENNGLPVSDPDSKTCSAKAFTSLSQMLGLCPAAPTKQGGFAIAGLAHKAKTTDLRGDRLNNPSNGEGQTIDTYAIAMAKSLPDFVFSIGGNDITLVPNGYSRFLTLGPSWRASSLAGVSVEETVYDGNNRLIYVRFLAHWEDSAWGSDYDMDMVSRIAACVGAECANHDDDGDGNPDTSPPVPAGQLRVTTRGVLAATGAGMRVGFVISGTTVDGDYSDVTKPDGVTYNSLPLSVRHSSEPTPAVHVFSPGASSASNLPTPLQLAAKYGSFTDTNNNDLPDLQPEWDANGDGLSDSFFFAEDPSQLGPKLASFLSTIATTSSSAAVVANTVSLQTSTRIYQARFDSEDWTGSVVSIPVSVSDGSLLPPEWDAATVIAGQDWDTGREFLTWDPDANGGAGQGIPFRWADLSSDQQDLLDIAPGSTPPTADGLGIDRLSYLRGDDSLELSNGGSFRDRPDTPLGDVVNSTPTVVGSPNFAYPDSLESVPYSDFKTTYADTECLDSNGNPRSIGSLDREPIVYFGANDGALHGISACTGQERIAFVPNAMYPKLNQLTSTGYGHQYYVDGPTTVVDAFWSGAWHTTLVGTLRGGGKGVFALDVTDPSRFDETFADQVVLWEIEATPLVAGSDFEELGFTFSQPAIVKAEGHGWVAVFGNGYHGKSGNAVLYIVRINDGTLLRSIDLSATGPGSPAHGTNNGLSTISPIDSDGDGEVDLIYGGDRNGNVWRFAATASGFTRANTTLLYSARSDPSGNQPSVAQPITSRLAVGLHPTSPVGRIVYFGTGKYYETVDQDPANAVEFNTMYGIWDRDTATTVPSVTTRNSNTLQQQTIDTQTTSVFGGNPFEVRVLSDNPIAWVTPISLTTSPPSWNPCGAGASCGWYLDLTENGEKMVANPILRGGRLIFVTTTPSLVACDAGGTSWLMEIDPASGGRLDFPVFDLSGDGVFDLNDNFASTNGGTTSYTPVSGKRSKVGILQPPAILAGVGGRGDGSYGGAEVKYASGSNDAQIDVTIENPGLLGAGRKSWVRIK